MLMKVMGGVVMTAMSNLSLSRPMSICFYFLSLEVSILQDQTEENDGGYSRLYKTTIS